MKPNPPGADRWFAGVVLGIILGGAALALYRIGEPSLWLDETYTWWFTRLVWADLLQAARIDAVNPPLFYLYVKVLSPEASEAALRFPSALAHVAGICGAILVGRLLAGRTGGIAAGITWAVHPLTLWAARDARPYALAAALGVGVFAAFIAIRRRPNPPVSIAGGVLLAVGFLTHYFFFVFAATLVAIAMIDLRTSPALFRRWTSLTLLAIVPLLAWLAYFFSQGAPSLGIGWIRTPIVRDIPLTLWNLASGYAGVFDLSSSLLGAASVGLVAGAVVGRRDRYGGRLLTAGVLLPVASVWLISQRRPVYVDRYFIVLMPLVAGLIALGASTLAGRVARWPRPARTGIVVFAVALGIASGVSVHREDKFDKEDWRGLVGFLQAEGASIETTSLSEPEITLPLSYYGFTELDAEPPDLLPACGDSCWWVLRQPYTATHALTQSVSEAHAESSVETGAGCSSSAAWSSQTGIEALEVSCPP